MRDKAVSIDLNTNVEVGEESIIVPGDKATFQKKNSEKYLGLLSNMKSQSGNGWMTTTNKEITLVSDNGTTAVLNINGKQYTIDSSTKLKAQYDIKPKVAGDVTSVKATASAVYYVVKDKIGNRWLGKYTYSSKETTERFINGPDDNVEIFLPFGQQLGYIVSSRTTWSIRNLDTDAVINNGSWSDRKPANNGWFYSNTDYTLGRDDKDQYYAWGVLVVSGTAHWVPYMGCVGIHGDITGEPFPCTGVSGLDINTITPQRLSNGVLKWARLTNSDAELLNHMVGRDYTKWDISTIADVKAKLAAGIQMIENYQVTLAETGLNYWVMAVSRNMVYYFGRSGSANAIVSGWPAGGWWVTNDPSLTPGVFWSDSVTEYDNVFPCKYFFTNKQGSRGKTFSYGPSWSKTYSISAAMASWNNGSNVDLFDICTIDAKMYEYIGGVRWESFELEANNNGDSVAFASNYGLPVKNNAGDNSVFIDSTSFTGNTRRHPLSSAQFNNKAWSDWCYQIGGNNYGNNGLAEALPHYIQDGNFSPLFYSGYCVGFSFKKCLINTPNQEIDVWNYYYDNGNYVIATSENVYVIGPGEFKIKKMADFLFATNCVTEWNTLQESRNGNISLIRAFIPYNQSLKLNYRWHQNDFKAPADGSGANDVWLEGAAINPNLEDKYLASSFLLPAVTIPIYVNGGDLKTFNKNVITANVPLFIPVKDNLLYNDEKLDVYYTHTQDSTDIIYRYTLKGSDEYFDSLKEDNSWWLTSTSIMFPIGIGSKFSGINYMASTVDLEGEYTARLYSHNNQGYLIYNLAEQVYYGSTIFTIYTNNYYYDGEAIYSIVQGANEFVCYAIGLKFLGNSGTEAYFYSPYDKCIYLFSGSNTLTKARSLAKMAEIVDSMFSSVNQRMYILDANSKVLWLSNETSGLYELSNIDHLESSEKGAIFVGNKTYLIYSPKEEDFTDVVPIDLETSWIGDNTSLQKFNFATIQLYSPTPVAASIKMLFQIKDGTDIKEQMKTVNIKKSDWKGTYLRLRASPENATGQAFKFKVHSDDMIKVMNIEFAFEQVSNNPSPAVPEISV